MKEILSNGSANSIAQAIEEMRAEQGESFSLENNNLAELTRQSGVSRGKLRRLKRNGFQDLPRTTKGRKHAVTKLSGYTGIIDGLLKQGTKNSSVVLDRLRAAGFDGGATIEKEYIAAHKHLIPAKRQQVAPQGNRGRRYTTEPGEAFQMDWGFTDVLDCEGRSYRVACFAMICHHCGQRYGANIALQSCIMQDSRNDLYTVCSAIDAMVLLRPYKCQQVLTLIHYYVMIVKWSMWIADFI